MLRCLLMMDEQHGDGGAAMRSELEGLGLAVDAEPLPPPERLAAVVAAAGPPDLVAVGAALPSAYDDAVAALGDGDHHAPAVFVAELLVRAYAGRPGDLARDLRRGVGALGPAGAERAARAASNGLLIADALRFDFPIIYVNPGFERLSGYRADEVLGRNCRLMQGPETDPEAVAAIAAALRDGREHRTVLRNHRKDGTPFWNELVLSPVRDDHGTVVQWVGVQDDVTERLDAIERLRVERNEARLRAAEDPLTGLATRRALDDALATALRDDPVVALLQVDLDRFRDVNGALGRGRGDRLLRLVGERLAGAARDGDLVAYLGEDQYAVLVRGAGAGAPAAERTARLLLAALEAPMVVDGAEAVVEASAGLSEFPRHASDATDLLDQAERALQAVKDAGGGAVRAYEPELRARREPVTVLAGVRRALLHDELVLHYQPVFDLATGRAVGAEALLRWEDPRTGLVPPGDFIPVIEHTGLIEPVGQWVVQELCRQAAAWRDEGLTPHLGFNISPRQLRSGRCVEALADALAGGALDPARFTAEITESASMEGIGRAIPALDAIVALGVELAIDDFGTGYSSLGRLRDLPVTSLKIDRSFLRHVPDDPEALALVRAIVDLAGSLDLTVVAEGIETAAQLDALVELGCGLGQGFLLGRPVPAAQVAGLLRGAAPADVVAD